MIWNRNPFCLTRFDFVDDDTTALRNTRVIFVSCQVFLHATTSKKQAMQLKMRNIEWWMRKRHLPQGFRQRVRNYERQRWAAMRGVDECEMIRNLPEGLRRDIKYHLCLDLVRQVMWYIYNQQRSNHKFLMCPIETTICSLQSSLQRENVFCFTWWFHGPFWTSLAILKNPTWSYKHPLFFSRDNKVSTVRKEKKKAMILGRTTLTGPSESIRVDDWWNVSVLISGASVPAYGWSSAREHLRSCEVSDLHEGRNCKLRDEAHSNSFYFDSLDHMRKRTDRADNERRRSGSEDAVRGEGPPPE